jgi:hypothetical protein
MEGLEDVIISETTKVFEKAIKRYASENKVTEDRISIILYLINGDDNYTLCIDNNPIKDVNIKDILGVKIMDMKGYSVILPPQIVNILKKLEDEHKSNIIDVSVHFDINGDEDKIRFFLYKEEKLVKEIFLEEIIKT